MTPAAHIYIICIITAALIYGVTTLGVMTEAHYPQVIFKGLGSDIVAIMICAALIVGGLLALN